MKQQDWREQFSKEFGTISEKYFSTQNKKDVKDFIQSQRSSLIEELREEVKGMKKDNPIPPITGVSNFQYNSGYNQTLSDLDEVLAKKQ